MDKEFGSFVVTDPNLVDEGIDVSGLKTKTDVSPFLLGNIADYPGIQYEAFNPTRLTDLMRLYSSGLPMIDTPTAAVPPATGGGADSGGGGQATLPGFDVDSPKNTEANQRLLDQGIQSAEDDKGDVMLEDFEMANLGGITGDLVEVEDLINYQFGDDAGSADPTGLDMSGTMGGAPVVFDINQTGDPTTTMLDVPTNTVGLAYTGEFDPNDEGTVFDTTSITPEDTEQSITQKVADFLGVDTSTINKAAITSALNLVGGKALDTVIPIATVFDLVKDSFTKSPETSVDTFDTTPAKTSQGLTTSQFQAFKDTGAGEFDTTPIITEQEQIEAEYREANRIAQQREADQAFADQAAQKTTPDYSNVTTASAPPGRGGGSGGSPSQGGGSPGAGSGCVIATHAVNSGAFTKDTKREAVRWCVKNLHRTWWGEAVRRGYRYYGQKAIEEGNAKNHYQEFKDYVAFGTGKRRTLKTGWTFIYRTVQFFLKGLTL